MVGRSYGEATREDGHARLVAEVHVVPAGSSETRPTRPSRCARRKGRKEGRQARQTTHSQAETGTGRQAGSRANGRSRARSVSLASRGRPRTVVSTRVALRGCPRVRDPFLLASRVAAETHIHTHVVAGERRYLHVRVRSSIPMRETRSHPVELEHEMDTVARKCRRRRRRRVASRRRRQPERRYSRELQPGEGTE